MKYTVIIPTRERSDTLFHALKTCVSQDYDQLEIIVSDNFSNDNTKDIVHSFKDKRIKYVNTGKRVSMTGNWEFALSHTSGDGYVTYIGDDDGLLPNAINDINQIVSETKKLAVVWLKADYHWPSHLVAQYRNRMKICLENNLFNYRRDEILRDVKDFKIVYNRCPCLYNAFVKSNVLETIKKKCGKFFNSVCPDIYSGFAIASIIDEYIYSIRPFSVNGASSHSTGAQGNIASNENNLSEFFDENDIKHHPQMRCIAGSVVSAVAESLFQANDYCYDGKLKINTRKLIKKIVYEISRKESQVYKNAIKELLEVAKENNITSQVRKYMRIYPNKPFGRYLNSGLNRALIYTFNTKLFNVHNVFDACELASKLVGAYQLPSKIYGYSRKSKFFSRLHTLAYLIANDKTL